MSNEKELKFKRHWERRAKELSEERAPELVFGQTQGAKWSRTLDVSTFRELETFLGIDSGHRILDIGCGPLARAEVQLSSRCSRIVGLDISKNNLEKAKESIRKYFTAGNIDFVLGDAELLPFRDNGFDVLLCIGTISHLPALESVRKTVLEMKRVVRPRGIIFIPFWLNLYSVAGIQRALTLRVMDTLKVDRAQFLLFRGLREINAVFNCSGLRIRKIRYGVLFDYPFVLYSMPRFIKRMVNKFEDVLNEFHKSHSNFSRFSFEFEVTCENVSPSHFQSVKPDTYYQFF